MQFSIFGVPFKCTKDMFTWEKVRTTIFINWAKNSVWVQAVTKDGIASKSTGTFVVGRTFVTTAHSVLTKDFDFTTIAIQNPNSKETLDIPIKDCKISRIKQKDDAPTDLVLITLPPVVPSRPKIINKFIRAVS